MIKIALQAGHEGRTTGATGAPGEQAINVAVRNRLSQILISKGFQLFLFSADPTTAQLKEDYDLCLALHCDANIYGTGGGVVASGDSSVDLSWKRSAEIRDAIISEYFKNSEIVNHPERSNKNMTQYYLWSKTSVKTPCVIIEMGVAQDAHDKVLLNDTERIATALARGVCKAFGVSYEVSQPPATTQSALIDQINDLKKQLETAQKALLEATNKYKSDLALMQETANNYRISDKLKFKTDLKKFAEEY